MVAIRRAGADDAPLLATRGAELFTEAYGPTHREPALSRYLAAAFSATHLETSLSRPHACFLIGEDSGGYLIAYAHLSRSQPGPGSGVQGRHCHEIHRFYLDARYHGTDVAKILMAHCLNEAARDGSDTVWLQVWKEAPRAIRFYQKSGFQIVGEGEFPFGDQIDFDWVMSRAI